MLEQITSGAALPRIRRSSFVRALKPLDNGSQEIRALDGLRAVAAMSIVAYHTLLVMQFQYSAANRATGDAFYYLTTGVQLFFVLSGFLLFLPYARAMLLNRPLPSALRFYKRRALRILPAYWVALAILALLPTSKHVVALGLGTIVTHVFLIHDMFPDFNRDLEGPFWTLAVEVQFYVLLPLLALILARVVGRSRSLWRLLGGIVLLIVLALGLRALDVHLANGLPTDPHGVFDRRFILLTMGMQGKYLEVFFLGMLASTVYVATVELGSLSLAIRRRLGWVMLLAAAVIIASVVHDGQLGTVLFVPGRNWGIGVVIVPFIVGLGYATLLLAILWGSRPIRWLFETPPMRFIGLISYSLYIWHLPVISAMIPLFQGVRLLLRVLSAFGVAYLSYQFVERPFLKRRHRNEPRSEIAAAPQVSTASDEAAAVPS